MVKFSAYNTAHCIGDYCSFTTLVADDVKHSFEPYWSALGMNAEMAAYLEDWGYGS